MRSSTVSGCSRARSRRSSRGAASSRASTARPATTSSAWGTSRSRPPGSRTSARSRREPSSPSLPRASASNPTTAWSPRPGPSAGSRTPSRRSPTGCSPPSVADVPVAALLSGGIDSSLVVATHERAGLGPTSTFNVRFPDKGHDETDAALAAATHCHTRHHTIDLADSALSPDALFGLLRHFDQPFADTSLVPMYWISRAVREQGIICTLSGDGGDEVFGGYPCFWRANHLMRASALPAWLRRATRRTAGALTHWTQNWGRQVTKALTLAEAGLNDSSLLLAGLANYLSEDQKGALVRAEARG